MYLIWSCMLTNFFPLSVCMLTPSHYHIIKPSLHQTITPSHPHTITITSSNHHSITPSHYHTITPSHPHTITLSLHHTQSHLLGNLTEVPVPVRFIFFVLGPDHGQVDYHEVGRAMATLMSDTVSSHVPYSFMCSLSI